MVILGTSLLASCRVFYPNVMFDVDKELEQGSFASTEKTEYTIRPGDKVAVLVFTNQGYNQVNTMFAGFGGASGAGGGRLEHEVKLDGTASLPVIGPYKIAGMTITEAENKLAAIYNDRGFTNPMVILEVTNWRAFVFIGSRGSVVTFENSHITLIEALTMAGGIPDRIKSHKVKLIRELEGQRQVQVLDMSGNEALSNASVIVYPGDILHVEAVRPWSQAAQQVTSIIAYATTAITIYLILTRPK